MTSIHNNIEKLLKSQVFCTFDRANVICANFHGHIRVQHVKIRKYTLFRENLEYGLFKNLSRLSRKITKLREMENFRV